MLKDCKYYEGASGIFNGKGASGVGNALDVGDFKNILLTLSSSGTPVFTVNFQGSGAETCPNFAAVQSATNKWEYIQIKDRQNDTGIDGDTGVTFGANDVRVFELNTNVMKWLCAKLTWTGGKAYLDVMATNNI